MGRGVTRVTRALLLMLLAGVATAQAQVQIVIDDPRRVVEGSSGPWSLTPSIAVRILGGPPPANVTVDWAILPGSAKATDPDYTAAPMSGSFTFLALTEDTKFIDLQVIGDSFPEWSPTLQQDEVFFIQLSNPSANATILKGRTSITLLDDDHPTVSQKPGVQFLTAVARSVAPHSTGDGQVKLQWRVPAAQTPATDVVIRWNIGGACTFPVSHTDGMGGASTGPPPGAGMVQTFPHNNLPIGVAHCYSVFSMFGGVPTTERAQIKATPFNAGGTIAWRYYSGSTSVVPPTVGADAVYTVDNLGVVHAMVRGAAGGFWPNTPFVWNPVALGAPTQHRSAVVPMPEGSRIFLGTDGGGVHSVDGRSGHLVWSRSAAFLNALPNLGGVQAPPAGLFKAWGGNNDMLLVGTNNGGSNKFFALDPATGNTQGPEYVHAQMGSVNGMAVVDYASNRVYFLTNASSATFYGLSLGPIGTPTLSLATLPSPNPHAFLGSNGSAVLRSNRVIFGGSTSQVFALDLVSGASYNASTGDGPVKGFLWPDRRDDRLYFATDGKVQAFRDTGAALSPLWWVPVTSPSMVLQRPGTDCIYVGDGNGNLVQIDVATQTPTPLLLEGPGVQIGAPSLDGPNNLLIVGSSTGTIHAVRVPF